MVDVRVLLMAPALMAVMLGVFTVVNQLNEQGFEILDGSSNIFYINILKIFLGIIPLVIVIGIIYYSMVAVSSPQPPPIQSL